MEIQRKEVNYIYFFFDQFGKRIPLIAGSDNGIIFYSHDKKDNKVPLATMSLKADDLKRATLIDREYSRILTGIARECDLSPELYVWINGTKFKLKKPEELDIERIHEILNGSK